MCLPCQLRFQSGERLSLLVTPENVSRPIQHHDEIFVADEKATSIPAGTFQAWRFERIIFLSSNIRSFGASAFNQCYMRTIQIPASVQSIDERCFHYCDKLERVEFPRDSKLKCIGKSAFENCGRLRNISIPVGVEVLKARTFAIFHHFCPRDVPQSIDLFFRDWNEFPHFTLTVGNKLKKIEPEAFSFSHVKTIHLPASLDCIYGNSFVGANIEQLTIDPQNQKYSVNGPVITSRDGKTLVACFKGIEEYEIPENVEVIGEHCFEEKASIKHIRFAPGSHLKRICCKGIHHLIGLQSIEIPASVEVLEEQCLSCCRKLVKITFEPGSCLKKIGAKAFHSNMALEEFEIPSSVEILEQGCFSLDPFDKMNGFKRVTFSPDGEPQLKVMGDYIFHSSGITSFQIPASVEEIKGNPFDKTPCLTELTVHPNNKMFSMLNSTFLIEKRTKSIVSYVEESKSVVIPACIRVLGTGSFANHKTLENITFEKDSALVAIGADAFFRTPIKRIKIPASVQLLESRCLPESLEHVQFENVSNLRQISEEVHKQCTKLGVNISSHVEILKDEEKEPVYLTSGPMLVPEP